MKQYSKEEIDFLQKSLDGEQVEGRIPNGTELGDLVTLANQGVLNPNSEEFEDMCRRQIWSSASPTR